jgi:hypothetical protein
MSSVAAVSFPNANGLTLFGTLHRGATVDPSLPAVVLLSPGVKMRVGPGRLYVPLTDMLTAQGYTVLRFDSSGSAIRKAKPGADAGGRLQPHRGRSLRRRHLAP